MKPRRANLRPVSPSTLRILTEDAAAFAMLCLLGLITIFGLAMAVPDNAVEEPPSASMTAPDAPQREPVTATAAESAATFPARREPRRTPVIPGGVTAADESGATFTAAKLPSSSATFVQ